MDTRLIKPDPAHSLPVKTRFAPSPTGLMHFGNLRVAIFNYLFSRKMGGRFLLRIEDTDVARSELHFREAILLDLKWMGLHWEEGPFYQSERQKEYDNRYQELTKQGLLYPCFCTEEQLAITRRVQLSSGQPPRYPGTCRNLTEKEVEAKKEAGIPWTLRFHVPKEEKVIFKDLIKGEQTFETDHIGDFIVRRGDGSASFMFCNAVDDALMGITHALRGDDHLTNTPRQILILQALKLPVPQYGHFPTILGPDSKPLSKRNGSRSIQELRETGHLPEGILNYLARLGHYDPEPSLQPLAELPRHFELDRISSAPAHFDAQQLNFWQKEAMHHCSMEQCWQLIAPHVVELVPEDKHIQKDFIALVKPNLIMPADARKWAEIIFEQEFDYSEEAKTALIEAGSPFFIEAASILDTTAQVSIQELTKKLQEKTGKKGKALFFPLRAALTGEVHGPELAPLLALIGQDRARHRLLEAERHTTAR